MVSSQIINRLHDAELVIADLSFHNANAFYEMAIRHKAGKAIIHIFARARKFRSMSSRTGPFRFPMFILTTMRVRFGPLSDSVIEGVISQTKSLPGVLDVEISRSK
jgi:hypothetical protein